MTAHAFHQSAPLALLIVAALTVLGVRLLRLGRRLGRMT